MSLSINDLCSEIEQITRLGQEKMESKEYNEALDMFQQAHAYALQLDCECILKRCEFNLGALYIYLDQSENGLQLLKSILSYDGHHDEAKLIQLHYYIGLAYLNLKDYQLAIDHLTIALESYMQEEMTAITADILTKIGQALSKLNQKEDALLQMEKAKNLFSHLGQIQEETECMVKCIKLKIAMNQKVTDELQKCAALCRELPDTHIKGKLLNDLGLIHMQLQNYSEAAVVFEYGLTSIKGEDKRNEAVIYQNLGAVYNALGEFQKSLNFHESAAQMYASYGNRNAQGQCYFNLAFAASKLSDLESAWEAYLHSALAAKDSEDAHNEWQAYEGLGSVAFRQGKLDRAVQYFQKALGIVSHCPEEDVRGIQQRIIGKLTHTLRSQLAYNLKMAAADTSYNAVFSASVKSAIKPRKKKKKFQGRSISDILLQGETRAIPSSSETDSEMEDGKKKSSGKGGSGKKSKSKSESSNRILLSRQTEILSDLSDSDSTVQRTTLSRVNKKLLHVKDSDGLSLIPLMDTTNNYDLLWHLKNLPQGITDTDSLTDVTESDMETIRPNPDAKIFSSNQVTSPGTSQILEAGPSYQNV